MSKSGKGSRARAKGRRDAQKRSRREANRARYAGIVGTAANRKRKNQSVGGKSKRKHTHPDSMCGNISCLRCYSTPANNPWLADKDSCIYGKRWSSPLHRRQS